jgi:hypothetical protein
LGEQFKGRIAGARTATVLVCISDDSIEMDLPKPRMSCQVTITKKKVFEKSWQGGQKSGPKSGATVRTWEIFGINE